MKEIWKDCKGYEGLYQVSSLGRVWSVRKQRYLSQNRKTGSNEGYMEVVLIAKNGKKKYERVHRLVALAFLDNPNSFPVVNHLNSIKDDNRVENLEWMTRGDNIRAGFENNLYTYQKAVYIIDKVSEEKALYRNMALASRAMGKNVGYLSCAILRGRTENDRYKWELKDKP